MTDGPRRLDTEVVIVGAGPVGLCLAVELGARGVASIVLEQRGRDDAPFPTANHIGVRTMEHLRRLGLAAEVRGAFRPDWGGHWIALCYLGGPEVARVEDALAGGGGRSDSPEAEVWAPKPCFDPILARRAESLPDTRLEYGVHVDAISREPDGVTCAARERSGARLEVRARFAVACDGAASPSRSALGLALVGPPPLPFRVHSVFFRSRRVGTLVPRGGVQYALLGTRTGPTATPVGAGILVAVDGRTLWRLHGPGLQADDARATAARLAELGADDAEILATSAWTPSQGICSAYRAGRVFLAGDAAHVATPFGGLGVNTGMADAFDLGWKLDATLRGWGGPGLLDESYDFERRLAARDLLAYQGVDFPAEGPTRRGAPLPIHRPPDEGLWEAGPAGEAARLDFGRSLVESRGDEFLKPQVDLGYRYDGSPIVVDDGSPPPDRSQPHLYQPTARPGGRAPHVVLEGGASSLDLFGAGFCLLRTGPADPGALERAARERGVPLRVESAPEAAPAYERALTLVRPDGFVAWRGDESPADPGAVLGAVCGRVAVPA